MSETITTCDQFIEALYEAGWRAPNDAQHHHIKEVWENVNSHSQSSALIALEKLVGGDMTYFDGWVIYNGGRRFEGFSYDEIQEFRAALALAKDRK